MVRPLDESQGSPPLQGFGSWLMCEVALMPCLISTIKGFNGLTWVSLGPLHTRAKSRDHEFVAAQKKCPEALPRHFQNHVVWSWVSKCSVY